MVEFNKTSRRAVLSAIAGGVITGSGTVTAQQGPPHEQEADRGIVVQIEDCKTAHIRGSETDFEEAEVTAWEADLFDQVVESQWTIIYDLPATIEMPGEPGEPSAATIKEIEVRRFEADDFTVATPDDWGCHELVKEYAEE